MFPKRLAGPSACRTPHAPQGTVNSTGSPPDVGVVVGHPSSGAIHLFCRLLTGDGHVFHQAKKWLLQFGKGCFFGRPIVHFGVDVDSVFAVPWRKEPVIPDAL